VNTGSDAGVAHAARFFPLRGRTMPSTDNDQSQFETDSPMMAAAGAAVADPPDDFGRTAIHDPRAATTERDAAVEPRREGGGDRWSDLDWPAVIWIGGIHVAALAAPFFFTWSGLAICLPEKARP